MIVKTTDLTYAATLASLGFTFSILGSYVHPTPGVVQTFVFNNVPSSVVTAYANNTLTVNPSKLVNYLNLLTKAIS